MAEGTSVGIITLDLRIVDNLAKQIDAAAKAAERPAAAAGQAITAALSDPLKKAGKAMETAVSAPAKAAADAAKSVGKSVSAPVEAAADAAKSAASQAAEVIDNLSETAEERVARIKKLEAEGKLGFGSEGGPAMPPKAAGGSALASSQVPAEAAPTPKAPTALPTLFKAASDSVGLLNQKLDITYSQIGEQEEKLKALSRQYAEIAAEKGDGSGAAKAVDTQITAVQSKLVSLQGTALQTQQKIDKALESAGKTSAKSVSQAMEKVKAPVEQSGSAAEKAGGKIQSALGKAASFAGRAAGQTRAALGKAGGFAGKAAKAAGSGIGKAFGSASQRAGRSLQNIGHKAGGLARSVKSAFKSAFLMAGLYAAFRGLRGLMGGVLANNKEFAASLNLIKANLLTAAAPAIQALMPLLNSLASGFAAVSKQIATVSAGLFGQTYAQAAATAKKIQAVSSAAKKALGANDAINQHSKSNSTDLSALDTAQYDDAANFGQKIEEMLTKAAALVGPGIALILGKIAEAAPGFISAGANIINALLKGVNANFPAILTAGIRILSSLLDGLDSVVPQLGTFITNVITALLTGFLTAAPRLFSAGVTLLANVLSGLAAQMPALIPMAQQAVMTVMQALTDNLPQILDAAIQLITGLATGIINALPIIIDMAPDIIESLIYGLTDAIPKLVDAAINIIVGLVDYIINNLDKIIEAAIRIVIALAYGLLKAQGELAATGPKLIKALIDKLMSTDWAQVGRDIINGIVNGITGSVGKIGDAVTGIAGRIGNFFSNLFGGSGSTVSVPQFASGGIVSAPTLAMVGEYSGAGSNPEVISPLSELQKMLGSSGGDPTLLGRIISLLEKIASLLQENGKLTANLYFNDQLLQQIAVALIKGGYMKKT